MGLDRESFSAKGFYFGCSRFQIINLAAGYGYLGPGLGQSQGNGFAYSPTAPGYNRCFTVLVKTWIDQTWLNLQ